MDLRLYASGGTLRDLGASGGIPRDFGTLGGTLETSGEYINTCCVLQQYRAERLGGTSARHQDNAEAYKPIGRHISRSNTAAFKVVGPALFES